jgi:hypothetical protein
MPYPLPSSAILRDARTVMVGVNSTTIAGVNGKRKRVIIYPVSATPVYINIAGPAVLNQGAVVVQGQTPIVFPPDGTPGEMTEAISGIAAAGTVPVYVVDEFFG